MQKRLIRHSTSYLSSVPRNICTLQVYYVPATALFMVTTILPAGLDCVNWNCHCDREKGSGRQSYESLTLFFPNEPSVKQSAACLLTNCFIAVCEAIREIFFYDFFVSLCYDLDYPLKLFFC
jgi:hypothetical protein